MLILNQSDFHRQPLRISDQAALGVRAAVLVQQMLELCPLHEPTKLYSLPDLAMRLGVESLCIKDESTRLGLGSFKALGGTYAVIKTVLQAASRQLGRELGPNDLHSEDVRSQAASVTVSCATDGNHGRSVAAGARLAGCKAVIFVPANVSSRRIEAISSFGAAVIRVEGAYDDAVETARMVCTKEGWHHLSDTAWEGYEDVSLTIMQGYAAMVRETLDELGDTPTHVFVQAGVGGLAGAVAAHIVDTFGQYRPKIIVVQPSKAACFIESYRAGHPVRIPRHSATVMAMLDCHEPSAVGWRILIRAADAFMTVEDEGAIAAMNLLARPLNGDPQIVAGESGGVGLAGMLSLADDEEARQALSLGKAARVLLFNSEGATDPEQYEALTGMPPIVRNIIARPAA